MVTDVKVSPDRWPRAVGGHVVLDLVNTDVFAQDDRSVDVLRSAAEFLDWCADRGLPVRGAEQPPDGGTLVARATRLRTALRAVGQAIATGAAPPSEALAVLRSAYLEAVAGSTPVLDDGRLRWDQGSASPVEHLALAAVELLREGPTDRIKVCPSCGFLFLDTTKNRSRRWCSMDDCGTEEKMRRYVAKRARARRGG